MGASSGPPVKQAGTTRLYLSGSRAPEVAELFSASMLNARAIGPNPGAASALKVVYAAWTKCTDGLVLAIRALATIEGVDQALSEEWSISQPDLTRKSMRAAAVAAPKAWRYVGEMKEIAESFAAAGSDAGLSRRRCRHLAATRTLQRSHGPAPDPGGGHRRPLSVV